ncbi:hypothetical protein KIN20_010613 [Parelaphostrongylus tenuis]|uniref:Uncharacterized protein n=1 Tax=Parelaphostrongylus tenuis TaxID=148309 RepID=A0AAD5MTM7_PARTN|nr:hypothetical protein KIN20_010613 [Parelaphostrongylus tenuis]
MADKQSREPVIQWLARVQEKKKSYMALIYCENLRKHTKANTFGSSASATVTTSMEAVINSYF